MINDECRFNRVAVVIRRQVYHSSSKAGAGDGRRHEMAEDN